MADLAPDGGMASEVLNHYAAAPSCGGAILWHSDSVPLWRRDSRLIQKGPEIPKFSGTYGKVLEMGSRSQKQIFKKKFLFVRVRRSAKR